jgi:hypothetical protein
MEPFQRPFRPILRPAALCLLAGAVQAAVFVSVHPGDRQIQGGGTCSLTWTVTGTEDHRLHFEVLEGPDAGTVDAEGRYTAPEVGAERTFHVRATSRADGSAHAIAEIRVLPKRVSMNLTGTTTAGDVAGLTSDLFGEDWLSGHSERLPFLDLASGERFGDGKDTVLPWTPDPATAKARTPYGLKLYCPYGLPCTLDWIPMPHAEGQMVSFRSGTEVTRQDITGARSHVFRIMDRVDECTLEALRPGEDKGTWVSDVQKVGLVPRGIMPLAGSLRGNPGHEDGDGPAARFQAPEGMAWLPSVGRAAVADPEAHCISLVDRAGRARRLCGLPAEPGDRDGTLAVARFRSPAHLAVGLDPAGDRGGVLGPHCLYVADREAHVIRRIRSDDTVETYAGVPGRADFRDAEDPHQALFNRPQGITVTPAGALVVADQGNHRVRLIEPAGAGHGPRVRTLAGSGGAGADDGPALAATFTELQDLCFAALPGNRDSVFVIDGNAVREIRMDPAEVETLIGSVTKSGYQDKFLEEGKDFHGLANVPCLNRPTALLEIRGSLLVVDGGNRALRNFSFFSGRLETVTGPSPDPSFAYGLMSQGLPEPGSSGFDFARLGTPRGLCRPAGLGEYTQDLILSTEHRLVWGCGALTAGSYDRGADTQLHVEPPAAQGERKEPASGADPEPMPRGPCLVRFRVAKEGISNRVFYTVRWFDTDGSLVHEVRDTCVAGSEKVVQGAFPHTGNGKVVLTWVRADRGCGVKSVEILVH